MTTGNRGPGGNIRPRDYRLFSLLSSHFNHHPIYRHLVKKAMPRPASGPLNLHVGFYVESLGNFRSTEMTFDMDLYLYMSWQDDRMKHNETDYVLINDKAILDKMSVCPLAVPRPLSGGCPTSTLLMPGPPISTKLR